MKSPFKPESLLSDPQPRPRRYVLAQGARLATVGSMAALLASLGLPHAAMGEDGQSMGWRELFSGSHKGGHGTVKTLRGSASANGRVLAVGEKVFSGELIKVGPYSKMILSLSDNTIMRINADTTLTMEISAKRTGLFKLLVGSLLTVMPTGNRYVASLPTAVIGIKGTVFYQQIFYPEERVALDEKGQRVSLPEGISEYFCLCNGEADYMDKAANNRHFRDESKYHNSWYINPTLSNPMIKAPQLNHTDDQIVELVVNQEGDKHSLDFLKNYYTKMGEYD